MAKRFFPILNSAVDIKLQRPVEARGFCQPLTCWLLLVGLLWSSLASSSGVHHGATEVAGEPVSKRIGAGGVHEECALVRQHQQLAYRFNSSTDIDFNLHFHSADKADVTYLFGPAAIRHHPHDNRYVAPRSMVICLMWENGKKQAVDLEYFFSVTPVQG